MKHSQKSHSSAGYHNLTVVLFTLLCILICGSLALSPKAQTKTSDEHVTPKTVPGRNGKIAFTSSRDGDHEIYTMEPDGSNQTRLTNNPEYDISPKWSPDARRSLSSEASASLNREPDAVTSTEYQLRFGAAVTRSNADCQ